MFDFVAESFDLEKTKEYILSIQISLDGFSFSITSPQENKIIALRHTPLKISSENLILRHFSEWINNEEILQKEFSKTILIYFSTEFSLIPEYLFNSQLVKEATNQLVAESEQKYLKTNSIENLGTPAKIVFYLPKNFKDLIDQKFSSAELIHPAQLLLGQSPKGDKKNKVVLLYHKRSFIVAACRNEQVLLANSFNFEHINDLVYFLLNALMQLNLNLKETSLYISEALTKIDGIEEQLRPYFTEISNFPPSSSIENAEMIPNSIHRYFSFQ